MNLEEIKLNWEQDSAIDDMDISLEAIKNPKLHSKYLNELIDWKRHYMTRKLAYQKMRQLRFRYYRGELTKEELTANKWDQYQGPKHLKNEMVELLDGDPVLCLLKDKIDYAEICISALESIIKSIAQRGFDIKNFIEYEKFRSGF